MYEPPPGSATVLKTKLRDECLESRLVLESAGISAQTDFQEGWWLLVVSDDDQEQSAAELDAYRRENPDPSPRHRTAIAIYGGATAGVFVYSAIILFVAVMSTLQPLGLQWLTDGRMHAGSVVDGQWWRTITALTLHLDAGHVLSNLAFGVVFGLLAGRILGGGVAWLAIVLAGTLGNFMNAMVQAPTHSSIGASTAVFAALGVLVSHALHPRPPVREGPLKRWSPLICGVVLLAFTGVGGERTDVVAHVTGFIAGLLIGWVGCRLPIQWLSSRKVQNSAGMAAIGLVTLAWIVAFSFAN